MSKVIDTNKTLSEYDDDYGVCYYSDVNYNYLEENANRIVPGSFVYDYCLTVEQQRILDEIRDNRSFESQKQKTFKR